MDRPLHLRKVLVVQHVPHEPLGSLDRLLRSRKIRIKFVNFSRQPDALPNIAGYDALIVLGGPMNVDEVAQHRHLHTELELLTAALRADVPILGICLGAQLLAHALGAKVGRNRHKELGWHEVRLTDAGLRDRALQHLQPAAHVFHWHGDTFELPAGSEQLAASDLCQNQAFRYGRHAYGLQFHLEAGEPVIERWLRIYQSELALAHGVGAAESIRQQSQLHLPAMLNHGDAVFGELLAVFGWQPRQAQVQLGHRMTVPIPRFE